MLMALGIALSFILLLFLLYPNAQGKIVATWTMPPVELTTVDIPSTPPPPPTIPQTRTTAQFQYTNYDIVRNTDVKPSVSVDQFSNGDISTKTIAGDIPTGVHQPTASSVTASTSNAVEQPHENVTLHSEPPTFPGGIDGLREFLSRNLITLSELEAGDKKTVYVHFIVNEDGTVTQFEIVKSVGTTYDKEVLRVMKKMPKWKPAIQNGKNVIVTFTQPVTFQAVEE